jgi:hypothetical protein
MKRRDLLLRASAALLPVPAAARDLDLSGYVQTFSAEFNDTAAPLSVKHGGPFTTRFEEWGGLRTLPATGELELYVDADFVPAPGGTDKDGHADAPPGSTAQPLGYDPFRIEDGCLLITAMPAASLRLDRRVDRPYLTGLVSTEWSFAQRYGYFEMRADIPAASGLWPAFWMVGKTSAEHTEIDILEARGSETGHVYQSIHVSEARGKTVHRRVGYPGFDSHGMHTYGVDWSAEAIVFYIDGQETLRVDGAVLRDAPPMYLIACMAVGGPWPGTPNPADFPATMRIDYLRAYRRA